MSIFSLPKYLAQVVYALIKIFFGLEVKNKIPAFVILPLSLMTSKLKSVFSKESLLFIPDFSRKAPTKSLSMIPISYFV